MDPDQLFLMPFERYRSNLGKEKLFQQQLRETSAIQSQIEF